MDDVKVYAEAIDWLNLTLSVALIVLPTLIGLALTALFGAQAVEQGRKLWKSLRQTVDEPTDPIVAMLAAAAKQKPEMVSSFLVALFDATFAEAVPMAEREENTRAMVRNEISTALRDIVS